MSTPTNATEFCDFINNGTTADFAFDDCNDDLWAELWEFSDGAWHVKPGKAAREFVIENDFGGYIVWQGSGSDPYDGPRNVEHVFKEWKQARTTTTIVVVVPNEQVDAVMAALRQFGLSPS